MPRDAVGVPERHQPEGGGPGRHVMMPVADPVSARHVLHQRQRRRQGHRGPQPELRRRADRGAGRDAVHRDAGPHQVEVALLQRQGRGRVGDMPHLGLHAPRLGVRHHLPERDQLSGDRGMPGLVGAGEVRPQPGDLQQPLGLRAPRARDQLGPVPGLAAAAPEPGVRLELHPRGAAGLPGGRGDLVQRPQPAHRDVDIGLDRLTPGPAGRPQPAHDPDVVRHPGPRRPQRQRLLRRGGAQPGRTGRHGRTGAGGRAVPVSVGLNDGHQGGAGGALTQRADVGPHGGQIDHSAGSELGAVRVSCLFHPGQSLRARAVSLRGWGGEGCVLERR